MKKVERYKNQIIITAIAVFVVVVSMIGGSYALFTSSSSAGEYNVLKAGKLEISYVEGENGYGDILSLNGAYPVSDATGLQNDSYRFNITNTGNVAVDYRIRIENDEAIVQEDGCGSNLMDFNNIKYTFDYSTSNPVTPAILGEQTDHVVYDSVVANQPGLQPGDSRIHEIKVWIKDSAGNEVLGQHFHGKVIIETIQTGINGRLTATYNVGDSVTLVDNSTWHVLKKSTSSNTTITLIKDDNITTLAFDTADLRPTATNSYCVTPATGCNAYKGNDSTVLTDSSIKTYLETTYLDSLKQSLNAASGDITDLTVSLPSMEDLVKANNSVDSFNQAIYTFGDNYLSSTTYWTQTASTLNSSYVWAIDSTSHQSVVKNASDTTVGVRPVITTSKLNIKVD